jgi:hypothetical protein
MAFTAASHQRRAMNTFSYKGSIVCLSQAETVHEKSWATCQEARFNSFFYVASGMVVSRQLYEGRRK